MSSRDTDKYPTARTFAEMLCGLRFGVWWLALVFVSSLSLADERQLETRVKSAFIYNFTKYLSWPDDSMRDSLHICVARDTSVYEVMRETLTSKESQGRRVEVRLLRSGQEVSSCDVVYLPRNHPVADWKFELQAPGIVTVGEGSEFASDYGVFGFVVVAEKIRFDINLGLARQKGVRISSKLLSLAQRVVE